MSSKVWITGVGAATPVGHSYLEIAKSLLAGRSGIRPVTGFNIDDHLSQIAGQVLDVPCPPDWNETEFRKLYRLEQVILWCCASALRDAGRWEQRQELRVGLVLGVGAEWLLVWEDDLNRGGNRICDPTKDHESLVSTARRKLGVSGPVLTISAACASGNYALAQAKRWLQLGWVDICLAGACDMAVSPMSLAGFGNLRALSRRNNDPMAASRPFDRDRDGFVMGEGGAVFVLEPEETARKRSAQVYAEVAGHGFGSDAHNMVIPSPDPEPAINAMRRALVEARVNPEQIDYINAHATSTPRGDVAEARVIEAVFGSAVHTTPVSSTKSMTGHLLTAAAAVEALACLVAMQQHALPPTINLQHTDPECNLCHVANEAMPKPVRIAASNSFGFGGSNTCLILKSV